MKIFITFILLKSFLAQELILVEFKGDSRQRLGEWPVNRKWHALLIDKLQNNNAYKIIYDMDFKYKDPNNSDSDFLLYHKLQNSKNLLIQSSDFKADSIVVLGKNFPHIERVFNPYLNYNINNNILTYIKNKKSDLFKDLGEKETIHIDLRSESIKKLNAVDYLRTDSLNELVQGNIVFVGTDIDGISSYIGTFDNNVLSSTELKAIIYEKLLKNDTVVYVNIYSVALAILLIAVAFYYYKEKLKYLHLIFLVLASILILNLPGLYFPSIAIVILSLFYVLLFIILLVNNYKNKIEKLKFREADFKKNHKSYENSGAELNAYKISSDEELSLIEKYKSEKIIVAKGSPLLKVLKKAEMISESDIPVLITGESGTGKEVIAQLIHKKSQRARSKFIAVNCAALSETLLESELFGHESGAFTGAVKRKTGRFENANNGTIFLDEIGETSLNFQVKLLRVLQENYIERVGGTEKIPINVRVIAASNRKMNDLIEKNKFREDLYYRLHGIEMELPALRERKNDIPVLLNFFMKDDRLIVSNEIISWLKLQFWNGNIREFKASVQRAVINCKHSDRNYLIPSDFEINSDIYAKNMKKDVLAEKILDLYKAYGFQHRASSYIAKDLNIHRVTVSEYLKAWYLYYYNLGEKNLERSVSLLLDGNGDHKAFQRLLKKMDQTIKSIVEKLNSIDADKQKFEDGVKQKFKSFPSVFHKELKKIYRS